jgi:hypothetical protein
MCQCQVKWIDDQGQPTPDTNKAVMWAQFHYSITQPYTGKVERYLDAVEVSFPICADHYSRVTPDMRFPQGGWTFAPMLSTSDQQRD